MNAATLDGEAAQESVVYVRAHGSFADSAMRALADPVSRKMVQSAIDSAKTIEEISAEQQIPLSTCYRRMKELLDGGLMVVERILVAPTGRCVKYRSSFTAFRVISEPAELSVEVAVNKDVADKVHRRWMAMALDRRDEALIRP